MTKHQHKEIKKLVWEYIKLCDGGKCRKCGNAMALAPSHIYPQGRYPSMKYDPENILTFCYGCHLGWWHRNPIEANQWLLDNLKEKTLKYLKLRSQINEKSNFDYNALKLYFEKLIKDYEKN